MRNILLIIVAALSFISCENSEVANGRKLYKAYLKKNLKDPSSLVINNETYKVEGLTVTWQVDFSAKNGLGGMAREVLNCTTTPDLICIGKADGCFSKQELGL